MADSKSGGIPKIDANREAFQMRAQWHKAEICRKQWHERWAWLLDERMAALEKSEQIRAQHKDALPKPKPKLETTRSLKPVPQTSTGFVGWLANKPECRLEVYTSWLEKPPLRLPDTWEDRDYVGYKIT